MPLATIQKIDKLTEIPNADNIECARVLGWDVVVRRGEFKEGDLCIYIEIDSLLPRKEWSEFLFRHEEDKIYRLRTVKLRGQISQGLVLPIYILRGVFMGGGFINLYKDNKSYMVKFGSDVTEYLEITHYEKPIPAQLRGTIKGNFPSFIPKTDEVRIQSCPELLNKLKGKPYYITTKLDGTSATYYKYKGKFGVCSRNIELKDPRTPKGLFNLIKLKVRKFLGLSKKEIPSPNVYWKMVEKYKIDEWLPEGYAIQGEICGVGIQKNPLGLQELELFIFNIFCIPDRRYLNLDRWNWIIICGRVSGSYQLVPMEETNNSFNYTLEELLEKAKGKYPNTNHNKEGIVVRSIDQTISFKVVNNDYLLKDEE